MNSNFGFNNGMTIQIPAFNAAANDQIFLTIRNYFDIRFNELKEQIQQIKSISEKLISNTNDIEADLKQLKSGYHGALNCVRNNRISLNFNRNLKFQRRSTKDLRLKRVSEMEIDNIPHTSKMKKEIVDHMKDTAVVSETNSFLIGIENKSEIENKSKSNPTSPREKTCELVFDNIIEKYLKVKESKVTFKDILEPVVILNPTEKREIFVGGNENVKLPLWAYRKCLSCVRGKPNELNSRLCLRLLQAKFGRKYMLNHNYNGSGDKISIDKQTMSAILMQAKLQFPDQEDFQSNPAKFAMFRDYINNAFRVVAYRHRKGIQSNTPFWDQNGEPITDLDPPSWIVDHIN